MAQIISDNILADLPKVFDDKTGVFQAGVWRPYNTVGEFQARFPNVGVAETQIFWVRNPDDANKSDMYALRKNKTPYKVLDDVDFTAVYEAIMDVNEGLTDEIERATAAEGLLNEQIDNIKQPYDLNYTQANLTDTGGDGNYYLTLPDGISIIETKINNIEYDLIRDNNFTPNRLYGFANNSAQTIQLTVI